MNLSKIEFTIMTDIELTDYEIFTYKQRENIVYRITSVVVFIGNNEGNKIIKLRHSNRVFYGTKELNCEVDDDTEIIYKLVVENKLLKAYIVSATKI